MNCLLHILGVGSAQATQLGSSSAAVEFDGSPSLLIDCGPDTPDRYLDTYGRPPGAIYITHAHMDHIGGLERLFYRTWFDDSIRGTIKLYAHADLIPVLHARLEYPNWLAEGGANLWDNFRLIAVGKGFWHEGRWFDVFPTRHHALNTSFGLSLPGCFTWTGDTRPIPEALLRYAQGNALIAHDCSKIGNPSHTGLDDLEREYPVELRSRMLLYHYASPGDALTMRNRGYLVAQPGDRYLLPVPRTTEAAGVG